MASFKERLIQVVLRGRDLLSPEADKSREALEKLRSEGDRLREALAKTESDNNTLKALDRLNKEASRTEKELARAKDDVDKLREALNKAPGSKGLDTSLKAAEREARRAEKALDQLTEQISEKTREAQKAGIDTSKLSDEEKRLAKELDTAKRAVEQNTSATKKLQREQAAAARAAAEQESRTKSLRSALVGAEKRVLAFAAAYISLNAAFSLVRKGFDLVAGGISKVVELGDGAEKTRIQLEGIMNGPEGGAKAGQWIEEFADRTGQRINDVTEAFVGLKAYGLDPMDGSLEALLDKTAQLGGDANTLKGISLGLGQMWAKEKIVQEEVNQLRDRGVQVFDLLAKAMGKTSSEIQEMAAKGQLGRTEIKLLIDEIGKSAQGQAAKALDTLSGKWNVLLNQFQKFGETVASSGVLETLQTKLQGVLETIKDMQDDGTLDELAQSLGEAFEVGVEKSEELVRSLAKVDFKELAKETTEFFSNFGTKIDETKQRLDAFMLPFRALWNGLTAGISLAGAAVSGLVELSLAGAEKVARAWYSVFGGTDYSKQIAEMRQAVSGMTDVLIQQIEQDGRDISTAWDKALGQYKDVKKEEVDTAKAAEREKLEALKAAQAEADKFLAEQAELRRQALLADAESVKTSIEEVFGAIDSTRSVEELEKFRTEILRAGQAGEITQQQMNSTISRVNSKLREMTSTASGSAKSLKTLPEIMDAIGKAANRIDISQARQALDKLYKEGTINAKEHAQAQEALNKKVAELKPVAEKSAEAVSEMSSAAETVNQSITIVNNSMRQSGAMMSWMTGWINKVRGRLGELSDSAVAAFNELRGIKVEAPLDTSSWDRTAEAAGKVRREAGLLRQQMWSLADSGAWLSNWAFSLRADAKQVEASFLSQKASVQRLMEQYDSGTISLQKFVSAASAVKNRSDLLGESDLSPLISAIQSAKQQMDALADSTKSTLEQLNTELLELKGTQEEIEANRMAGRRRDLQTQLADAQKNGDQRAIQNLQQALRTLSEIEDERLRQARNAKAEEARKAADEKTKVPAQQTAQAATPAKVIRLEAGGKSVDVQLGSDSEETKLLSILEQYGMRSM